MAYIPNEGIIVETMEQVEARYLLLWNQTFGLNDTLEEFRLKNGWKVMRPAMVRDVQISNLQYETWYAMDTKLKNMQEEFFFSQLGMHDGIRNALLELPYIKQVSTSHRTIKQHQDYDLIPGVLFCIILLSEPLDDPSDPSDPNIGLQKRQDIANTYINSLGAGIISVLPDYTNKNGISGDYESEGGLIQQKGYLAISGQPMPVNIVIGEAKNIEIRYTYVPHTNMSQPSTDVIKEQVLKRFKQNMQFDMPFYLKEIIGNLDFARTFDCEWRFKNENENFRSDKEDWWATHGHFYQIENLADITVVVQ